MSLYNAGANIVYAAFGASVTVPVVGTWTPGLIAVPPGATQLLANPNSGSSLAYIAETAGGTLILSVGEGN